MGLARILVRVLFRRKEPALFSIRDGGELLKMSPIENDCRDLGSLSDSKAGKGLGLDPSMPDEVAGRILENILFR